MTNETAPLLLVRHADAGDRSRWDADQDLRPLSEQGRRQAESIVGALRAFSPVRILSSPAVRCVQTIAPLADALGIEIEIAGELREGRTTEALALLDGAPMALSSHGDVLPKLLSALAGHLDSVQTGDGFEKSAAWVLDMNPSGKVVSARYIRPAVRIR